MPKLITSISVFLLVTTAAYAERIIEVEPGLWEYSHTLMIPGLSSPMDQAQTECITPEKSKRSLSDLIGELSGGANCAVSNLKDTLNTVEFDLSCTPDLQGMTVTSNGRAEFTYGRTNIIGKASGMVSFNGAELPILANGSAHRIGKCPD
jgi:hypothetical protein